MASKLIPWLRPGVTLLFIAAIGALLVWNADTDGFFRGISRIPYLALLAVLTALTVNALAASLRLKIIAADIGHPISFHQAMAAVGGGSLAGAAFFQLAGQLMARGVIMGHTGIPFASVAVMTTYERLVAAILSALLALAGAYFIFGQIYLDQEAGGAELIKIACGLIVATVAGALVGHGKLSASAITPIMTQAFAMRFLRLLGLSLLVQLPMMLAYVLVAHTLSPQTSLFNIVAASAVVMFAASVPVSLAGWGVREMSAIVALGAIGMDINNALITAITVGIGSMLSMVLITAASLKIWKQAKQPVTELSTTGINFTRALAWGLPLAAATLVLFQLYVPISSGTLLNVNLADPLALVGAALFILRAVKNRQLPQWRWSHVNIAATAMTLALVVSLLNGAARYGWMEWALVNRFIGWFILLAFALTGALVVQEGGNRGLRIFLLTFAGSAAAIALMDVTVLFLASGGVGFSLPTTNQLKGFSQNHNFFAFQLLIALSATIVAAHARLVRPILLALLILGIGFAGSRSGWLTFAALLAVAMFLRLLGVRELVLAGVGAALLTTLLIIGPIIVHHLIWMASTITAGGAGGGSGGAIPFVLPAPPVWIDSENHAERLFTVVRGLTFFFDHPIFGAGLGAFRSQMIIGSGGQPLLIHSTIVWLLAELGLVGLAAFLVPALALLHWSWRWIDSPGIGNKLTFLCLVIFGVMSAPADMLYQRTFWLVIGAGLAVAHSAQQLPQKSTPSPQAADS